jgi:hypothetical protein
LNVFDLRDRLTRDYADYTRSFVVIHDDRIRELGSAAVRRLAVTDVLVADRRVSPRR